MAEVNLTKKKEKAVGSWRVCVFLENFATLQFSRI